MRLYREEDLNGNSFDAEALNLTEPQVAQVEHMFAEARYEDVSGLCKVATRSEIDSQGWSLNPGRYVGVAELATDDLDFTEELIALNEEL